MPASVENVGMTDRVAEPSIAAEAGGPGRRRIPRRDLGTIAPGPRDPLGILERQNQTRLPWLVPLRVERMAQSPFAFYRGSAAIMAADQARDPTAESSSRPAETPTSPTSASTPPRSAPCCST